MHAVSTAGIALRPGEVHSLKLEESDRERNTLRVHLGDIAQAVWHFASVGRLGKSAGSVFNVDGGVPAAHSR